MKSSGEKIRTYSYEKLRNLRINMNYSGNIFVVDHLSNNIYVLTSNAELLKILDGALPRFIEIQENSNAFLVWSDKRKTNLYEFLKKIYDHILCI